MVATKVIIDDDLLQSLPSRLSFLVGTSSSVKPNITPRILYTIPFLPVPSNASHTVWYREHVNTICSMLPGGLSVIGIYTPSKSSTDMQATALTANSLSLPFILHPAAKGTAPAAVRVVHNEDGGETKQGRLRGVISLARQSILLMGRVRFTDFGISEGDDEANLEMVKGMAKRVLMGVCQKRKQRNDDIEKDDTEFIVSVDDDEREVSDLLGLQQKLKKKKKNTVIADDQDGTPSPHIVNIYIPVTDDTNNITKPALSKTSSFCQMTGSIYVMAVVTYETSAGEALQAIREDITRTFQTRFDLMHESVQADGITNDNKQTYKSLPVRVIAWDDTLPVTEYMVHGENVEDDVASRFADVLSWSESKLDGIKIEVVEVAKRIDNVSDETEIEKVDSMSTPVQALSLSSLPSPTDEIAENEHIDAPPAILVNGVLLAIILTFLAILVKQFL